MTLRDPEVAALARQAVDLLGPDIGIDIEPATGNDPYRFGSGSWPQEAGSGAWTVWPLLDGRRSLAIHVGRGASPAQALTHLIDALSEYASESSRFWGVAFPACLAGHAHPAIVQPDDSAGTDEVVLRCPLGDLVVGRVHPAVRPAG